MWPTPIVRYSILAGLLVALFPASEAAGSFSVNPLRIHLDVSHPTSIFHVRNDGAERIVVQIGAVEWRQTSDGSDIYEPTTDLVLFPKIVEIEKGEEKNVRLGIAATRGSDRERALRVYFDELPVSKPGETAVRLALRLGVPVFILPPTGRGAAAIDTVALRDGTLRVRVRNGGKAHVMARKIIATGADAGGTTAFRLEQAGWYVLAGSARTFSVPIAPEECRRATTIRVEVEIEDQRPPERTSRLEATIAVSGSGCLPDSTRTSSPVR